MTRRGSSCGGDSWAWSAGPSRCRSRCPAASRAGLPATRPGARAHVVALEGDRFLTTDGADGLVVLEWKADSPSEPLPPGRSEPATLKLRARVTGLALLPGKPQRLAVSDADRGLSLVEVLP